MKSFIVLLVGLSTLLAVAPIDRARATTTTHYSFSGHVAAHSEAEDWAAHRLFSVPAPATIEATLRWSDADTDLNLFLFNPGGEVRALAVSPTANPETIRWRGNWAGTWRVGVKAKTGEASYHLAVSVTEGASGNTDPTELPGGRVAPFAVEQEAPHHSWTRTEALQHANDFGLITALRGSYRGHVSAMRNANPELQLYVYVNGAFAQAGEGGAFPSSWYARDSKGYKIRNNWGLWMMDVSNRQWVANRARTCAAFIVESGYDGCMIDNLGAGTLWPPSLSSQPINPATQKEWTSAEWLEATSRLADELSTYTEKPIVVNGLVSGTHYFDGNAPSRRLAYASNFAMAETFVRPAGQRIDEYRPESAWKADLDMLVDAESRGKSILAVTKVWTHGTSEQKDAWHRYALATFLLGDTGSHRFYFSYGENRSPLEPHPWWDLDLGAPAGPYYKSGGLYRRDFANGTVIVNPSGATRSLALGSTHQDLDGGHTNYVTLSPNSAEILRRV